MSERFIQWRIRLHGSPCCVCGRPAEALWVLTDSRVVAHGNDGAAGALCRLPNPRPAAGLPAAAQPRRTSAA